LFWEISSPVQGNQQPNGGADIPVCRFSTANEPIRGRFSICQDHGCRPSMLWALPAGKLSCGGLASRLGRMVGVGVCSNSKPTILSLQFGVNLASKLTGSTIYGDNNVVGIGIELGWNVVRFGIPARSRSGCGGSGSPVLPGLQDICMDLFAQNFVRNVDRIQETN